MGREAARTARSPGDIIWLILEPTKMDASHEIQALEGATDESGASASVSAPSNTDGLHPTIAILVALWYSFTAAAAMSRGFAFLYERGQNDYYLAHNLMWTAGIGIGIALAVSFVTTSRVCPDRTRAV